MKKIETAQAPKAVGPYSQAVQAGPFLFLSGQLPIDPKVGKITATTIEQQTRLVLHHLEAILKEAGLGFEHVVRAEVFLKDMNDFQTMNALYAEKFCHAVKPARQTVQVARLPMDALVEISCIAYMK